MLLNPLRRAIQEHQGFPILPGAFPVIGHLPAIVRDLPGLFQKAGEEVGTHFWLDFGFTGMELACLIPSAAPLLRNKVTTSAILRDLLPEVVTNVMIGQDGERHRGTRAYMNGPFQFAGLTASGMCPVFAGMIERTVTAWRGGAGIRLMAETRDLALALVFRLMGIKEGEFAQWREEYIRFVWLVTAPPIDLPGMPRPRARRARAWIDGKLRGFVQDARSRPGADGLLAAVVRAFDGADNRGGDAASDTQLIDNLRFMLLAGHETTAATMAWVVVELARRPEVWDALCQEASAVGTVPQGVKDLAGFPFAEALFRETLRLHPSLTMTKRRALVDFELCGRTVPAGTNLCVPLIHWSRHPDLFYRGEEFLPDRWLGKNNTAKSLEMLQFGDGPHFCIAYHLAWMEIVQFSVALALVMGSQKLRPRLMTTYEACRQYFPITHPPARLRVEFVRD